MRNSYLKPVQLALLGIVLLGWSLLSWQLGEHNLWIDEYNTLSMIQGSPWQVISIAANDFHPPLYFLMLHLWSELAGARDLSLRWPSIAASLLCLPLLAVVARRLADSRVALWSALLLSLAPAAIEYGRMARYYSLVTALGLLSTVLLLNALKSGRWSDWIAYGLSALGLLFTSYPSGILLVGQALAFVWPHRRYSTARYWLVTVSIVGLAFAPWFLLVTASQSVRIGAGLSADMSRSMVGVVLGVISTGYTFSVGETMFPWFPVAWIGLLVVAGLVSVGLGNARRLALPLIGLIALSIVFISLITTYVAVGTPFLEVSARGLFVLPYFALLLAIGLSRLQFSKLAWLAGGTLALVWTVSIFNLFTNQQYLNPIYITPAREAAEYVHAHAGATDLVVSDEDSVFARYLPDDFNSPHQLYTRQIDQVEAALNGQQIERIWLIRIGRDRTRDTSGGPDKLDQLLQTHYRIEDTVRYLPIDSTYLWIKNALLKRESYAYRLTIETYVWNLP